jgi:anti-anti-sigma factor
MDSKRLSFHCGWGPFVLQENDVICRIMTNNIFFSSGCNLVISGRIDVLEIEVNTNGSTKVVIVPSKVDGAATIDMEAVLRRLIDEGVRNIVCNFSRTEVVSEDGLAMFISVLKDFHRLQGKMVFCLLQPDVRDVFAAAGLTNLYHYYDQEEALQADVLRELSAHFDEYADFHAIRLRRDKDRLYIEIFLGFDGEQKMKHVQQSIDKIKFKLEAKIENSEVLIIPTTKSRI